MNPLLRRIKELAEQVYPSASRLDGRFFTGGGMCVVLPGGKKEIFPVGTPERHPEKTASWELNCENKADRLLDNPDHISARQSANSELKRYFGGIRIPSLGIIVTFSGLSQELDEALCAWIGTRLENGLTEKEWKEISQLSENEHMAEFGRVVPKKAA